jgi:hypothetical protein
LRGEIGNVGRKLSEFFLYYIPKTAKRYGFGLEALKEVIKGQNRPDYSLSGDRLVRKQVLETIQNELIGMKRYGDAPPRDF